MKAGFIDGRSTSVNIRVTVSPAESLTKTWVSLNSHLCPVHQHPFPILPLLVELQVRIWLPEKVLCRHRQSLKEPLVCLFLIFTAGESSSLLKLLTHQNINISKNTQNEDADCRRMDGLPLVFFFSRWKNHIWFNIHWFLNCELQH